MTKRRGWILLAAAAAGALALWSAREWWLPRTHTDRLAREAKEVAAPWYGYSLSAAGLGLTLTAEGAGDALLLDGDRERRLDAEWRLDRGMIGIDLRDREDGTRIRLEGPAFIQWMALDVVIDEAARLGRRVWLLRKLNGPWEPEDVRSMQREARSIARQVRPDATRSR